MKFKTKIEEISALLCAIPSWILAAFVASLVAMNLLANKSIAGLPSWLALDAGFIFSWVAFAVMDITVKRFGVRGADTLGLVAIAMNLFVVLMFFAAAHIPGEWSSSYGEAGGSIPELNRAVDSVFAGSWYVVFGSTAAIFVSTLFNNRVNAFVARRAKTNSYKAFAARSFTSTFLAQFVDNFTFALIVSVPFFGWSLLQAATCALTGAAAELLMEIIFSPLSYKIVREWERKQIGGEYIAAYLRKAV